MAVAVKTSKIAQQCMQYFDVNDRIAEQEAKIQTNHNIIEHHRNAHLSSDVVDDLTAQAIADLAEDNINLNREILQLTTQKEELAKYVEFVFSSCGKNAIIIRTPNRQVTVYRVSSGEFSLQRP